MDDEQTFTIEELAKQVDIPIRTIRYYISQGLLPGPGMRGKYTIYRSDHLMRLHLIRRLVEIHMPLQEIRVILNQLSDEDLPSAMETYEFQSIPPHIEANSPRSVIASLLQRTQSYLPPDSSSVVRSPDISTNRSGIAWRRWIIADGIELHIREDLFPHQRRKIYSFLERFQQTFEDSDSSL
jgi:DNA-binding transcriptional MerR regulator